MSFKDSRKFNAAMLAKQVSNSKLDNMLCVQKSTFDKTWLGLLRVVTPTKFVLAVSMPKLEIRVPKEEVLATRKIRVDLSDTKPKKPTHPIGKKQYKSQ